MDRKFKADLISSEDGMRIAYGIDKEGNEASAIEWVCRLDLEGNRVNTGGMIGVIINASELFEIDDETLRRVV